MAWRDRQAVREQYVTWYDEDEAARYDAKPGHGISLEEEAALLADMKDVVDLDRTLKVLDVGAGTGIFSRVLASLPGLEVNALEPSPAMLARLRTKLPGITSREGFTDAAEDAVHFCAGEFDVVISRQVVCGLYDPLQAFENWRLWLKPGGKVVVIDGLFSREAWSGKWSVIADKLPLSGVQTPALTPYLLERAGFDIRCVDWLILQRSGLISTFPCLHFCEPSFAMAGGGAAVPFPSPTAPFQQFFHVPLSNFQQVAQ